MTTFVQPRRIRLRASLTESAPRTQRRRCSTRLRSHRRRLSAAWLTHTRTPAGLLAFLGSGAAWSTALALVALCPAAQRRHRRARQDGVRAMHHRPRRQRTFWARSSSPPLVLSRRSRRRRRSSRTMWRPVTHRRSRALRRGPTSATTRPIRAFLATARPLRSCWTRLLAASHRISEQRP